nr:hypothetical protein [Lysobacter sp.]
MPTPRIVRHFIDVSDEEDDPRYDVYTARLGSFDWPTLLQSWRVLIISEAGIGKTHECKAQCADLVAEGAPAFFVELSELARNGIEGALIQGSEEHGRYLEWLETDAIATFFLDSLDELKLERLQFDRALAQL